MNNPIEKLLVCGGTHGNELTGVEIISRWQDFSERYLQQDKLVVDTCLVNELAIEQRRRFVEEDLNRQFTFERLSSNANKPESEQLHEQKLAQRLNQQYGPKSDPQYDLVIDIHNTTSNMGPCIILLESDEFERQLARFVKHRMSDAVILLEDQIEYRAHPYFCTIGKKGLMLEIGPQAHGCLSYETYNQAQKLLSLITEFIHRWNESSLETLDEIEAFKLIEEVAYPIDDGKRIAFLHPALVGADFCALSNGDVCFLSHAGDEITWQGDTVYPHFIGEAAYHHLNLAFATAERILF